MITVKNLILFTLVFLLMGCSDQKNVDDDQQDIVLTNTVDTGELMTIDGDLERGRKLYLQCRACHSLKENEPHKIGPNLFKIIGSKQAG